MPPTRGLKGRFQSGKLSFESLLEYPEVSEWIECYWSENVRRNYLYALKHVLDRLQLTPSKLLKLSKNEIKARVKKVLGQLQSEGKTAQAENIYYTVKSFLEYHEVDLAWKRREKPRRIRKKIAVENVLDVEDVYRMAIAASRIPA